MKKVFFELEAWEKDYLKEQIPKAEFFTGKVQLDKTSDAEIVSTFIFSKFNKETLDKFPNLKLISTMSTGYDHIDLDECKKRGIKVCNVPAYGSNTVAEHTFGLILSLSRNIHKAYVRTKQENNFSYDGLMGFDLKGKTIGVIGTGKIGCEVIKLSNCFGMKVLAYDAFPKEELTTRYGFEYCDFDKILEESDIISLHVPLLKETRHLINKNVISKMKKGVLLINTSRGEIIDTDALVEGLESGHIGGAGLDVLEGEFLIKEEKEAVHSLNTMPKEQLAVLLKDESLVHKPNVIVTPHLAFYSKEALMRILDTTIENIKNFESGKELKNEVKIPQ